MKKLNRVLAGFAKKYKNILITGGAGAIGYNLVRRLLSSSVDRIIILDNLSSGYQENIPKDQRITFIKGDIADEILVSRSFRRFGKIDIVFHLAAHFANQNSIEHPISDLISNGIGTINLLENSVKYKVSRFVYFSTSCVYKNKDKELSESDLDLEFETPYAISKYTGEKYVEFFNRFYDLPTVNLRIFNSFGPGERPGLYRNVIPNFFYKALRREPLVITGSGEETRNFTFVDDIVLGALLAAQSASAQGKTLNLGSRKSISINKLAHHINTLTGNDKGVIYKPRRKWDHTLFRKPRLHSAKKILGFKPEVSFEEGMLKTYQFFIDDLGINK